MEENNTEYTETELETETETTSTDSYVEEDTETDAGTSTEENNDSSQTGESENNVYENDSDNTDFDESSSGGSYSISDVESGADSTDGTPDDATLLDRLDALIETLTPDEEAETGGEEGTESGGEYEISEYDSDMLETLQSIQSTLVSIQTENELWHAETLEYRKKAQETEKSIMEHLECISLLLIAVGFFTALLCGGKFADIFFKRMKGDGE